jgi:hypothetical protein
MLSVIVGSPLNVVEGAFAPALAQKAGVPASHTHTVPLHCAAMAREPEPKRRHCATTVNVCIRDMSGAEAGSHSGPRGTPGNPGAPRVAPVRPEETRCRPGAPRGSSGYPGVPRGAPGCQGLPRGTSGNPGEPRGTPGRPGAPRGNSVSPRGTPRKLGDPRDTSGCPAVPGATPGDLGVPRGTLGLPRGTPGYPGGSSGCPGVPRGISGKLGVEGSLRTPLMQAPVLLRRSAELRATFDDMTIDTHGDVRKPPRRDFRASFRHSRGPLTSPWKHPGLGGASPAQVLRKFVHSRGTTDLHVFGKHGARRVRASLAQV